MARPPRDISTERLVSFPLLCYSYLIVGLTQSIICFGAYLWVFNNRGVESKDIFLLDPKDNLWLSSAENGDQKVAMSGGKEFDAEAQELIVRQVRVHTLRITVSNSLTGISLLPHHAVLLITCLLLFSVLNGELVCRRMLHGT